MASIQLKDRFFNVFLSEAEIQERIVKLANQLNEEYADKSILFISVLNGSFMFTSDLMRQISLDCEVQFVRYKSYEGTSSTGNVKELLGVPEEVEGRHVVVVEDIIETGTTIEYLSKKLNLKNPASVKFCALLFKPEQYHKPIKINYTAFSIGSEFVVGYGLDYDGAGRNLRDIYKETNQK